MALGRKTGGRNFKKGQGGRKKGAKDKVPRSLKVRLEGSIKAIYEALVREEPQMFIDAIRRLVHGAHGHDESGRAVAALRPLVDDHRFLHRAQRAVQLQSLNGDDARAIELTEELDAGVDRLELFARAAPDQNGARAAVALFADDLRSGSTGIVAEVIRQRRKNLRTSGLMFTPVDVKEDVVAHGNLC